MPENILFTINVNDVRNLIGNSQRTMRYLDRLPERMVQFRHALREELGLVVGDAIEIAFLRTVPEVAQESLVDNLPICDVCQQVNCTCMHDFIDKDHCLECVTKWSLDHSFSECIGSEHMTICGLHSGHAKDECSGTCSKHAAA